MSGKLFLVPNTLGSEIALALPAAYLPHLRMLKYWIGEDPKATRSFLKSLQIQEPIQSVRIERIDRDTSPPGLDFLIEPIRSGQDGGLISEAGCPAIADPGSSLVRHAQANSIPIVPLVGPSSLILGLMASGLNGQQFSFHGYLPVPMQALEAKLRHLETLSRKTNATQLFIETPYRNERLFECLLRVLAPSTQLCIARDLTLDTEYIATKSVETWRRAAAPILEDHPTVFLFLA